LMFYNESHLWKQRHSVVLIIGFDRGEEACLFPLGFRHVICMKRDMYKSAIILKYDTKLMTSEEERTRLLFCLRCAAIQPLVPSLCHSCQPRQWLISRSISWLFGCFWHRIIWWIRTLRPVLLRYLIEEDAGGETCSTHRVKKTIGLYRETSRKSS
jgi:hypothetical protein